MTHTIDSQELQRIEHKILMEQRRLALLENEIKMLSIRAGIHRTQLTHLENQKYTLLTSK